MNGVPVGRRNRGRHQIRVFPTRHHAHPVVYEMRCRHPKATVTIEQVT